MSKLKGWSITNNNVVVNYDGKTHIVPRTESLADQLIAAIKEGREEDIPELVSVAMSVEKKSNGEFIVKNGNIFVNGVQAPAALGRKILQFSNEGLPFKPLVKFAEKIQKNPSFRAVNELFTFLEKNDHPITEDGNFIAYKRVRVDFTDIYTGTFDNSVGNIVELPRNQVNEDPTITCSNGLHVANWDYAHTKFSSSDPNTDIMLEVEVDPSNVVAVPVDYDNAKMRVCAYKVLGVVDKENSCEVLLKYNDTNAANDSSDEENCQGCDFCEPEEEDEYPFETELDDLED